MVSRWPRCGEIRRSQKVFLFPLAKRVIILRVSTTSQDTDHEVESDSGTSIHSAQNYGHRVVHWTQAPHIGTVQNKSPNSHFWRD